MDATIRAYVGLGANLGEAEAAVRAGLAALDRLPSTRRVAVSRLYRTPAWGLVEQPDFINAVAALDTALAPGRLLESMLDIEREAGRDRRHDTPRWGPRVLDLDLLLYGDAVIESPGLQVPHPRLHERAFALLPLLEIAPDLDIPGIGPARDCLRTMAVDDIEAIG
ncbi:2-amino-4-hydroxy-6-hydroxymethyldihydropteridine diphosphokinase [Marilutibacter aestuarii]|uniref:2-amino-4-hydroxy-6-hydroxymethyldihydropteridine pyrophosphokinase n=1 Tax=Marilutibacter aestuarii TaxID=1706195 RepID=A0A507ZZ87_9GAMM|nr:2-amino-4-hydroxy-6-hydroxymethyldihydropteridine diphosphokinase [Lysobacter aestuarii]TQD41484.1 2-amino-4-hydroxy-6-hydroxymethyldihydropteridine diphosphokinase [Lysobacter aestuarii]